MRRPIIKELDTSLTAPECFGALAGRPYSFFLDSGMDHEKLGRCSFMGSDPFLVLRSRGDAITLIRDGVAETRRGNPFDVLGELLETYALDAGDAPVPFTGGAVGYFSYDLCHFVERLPTSAVDDLQLPECYLGFYDAIAAFDHLENKAYIVSTGFPELDEARRQARAQARLQELEGRLLACETASEAAATTGGRVVIKSNFSHAAYLEAVSRVRDYICAGDIFQVNLSQRFEADLDIPPYELYQRLRGINPAPFGNYFDFEGVAVAGVSPERYMKVIGDTVETRPIKGTRPRGKTPAEDQKLARELLDSYKDRAENVMIVDLERNDIGRVCRYGSVKVTELAALETWPTVFHLTSTVVGRLAEGKNRIDLLEASFPGGSITGAPKVRAMEIIDELEPTRRSVYTGSLGYLGFNGNMDLDIVIRTMIIKDGRAYFQMGGGIVYDSEPQAEYIETLDKGRAIFRALTQSPDGEVEITA